jgi:hypothetical protein
VPEVLTRWVNDLTQLAEARQMHEAMHAQLQQLDGFALVCQSHPCFCLF